MESQRRFSRSRTSQVGGFKLKSERSRLDLRRDVLIEPVNKRKDKEIRGEISCTTTRRRERQERVERRRRDGRIWFCSKVAPRMITDSGPEESTPLPSLFFLFSRGEKGARAGDLRFHQNGHLDPVNEPSLSPRRCSGRWARKGFATKFEPLGGEGGGRCETHPAIRKLRGHDGNRGRNHETYDGREAVDDGQIDVEGQRRLDAGIEPVRNASSSRFRAELMILTQGNRLEHVRDGLSDERVASLD